MGQLSPSSFPMALSWIFAIVIAIDMNDLKISKIVKIEWKKKKYSNTSKTIAKYSKYTFECDAKYGYKAMKNGEIKTGNVCSYKVIFIALTVIMPKAGNSRFKSIILMHRVPIAGMVIANKATIETNIVTCISVIMAVL